jgi:hypothetical protein
MFFKQVSKVNKAQATQKRSFSALGNNATINDAHQTTTRTGDYTIIDHTYDAIVVGAGGAGLRVSTFADLIFIKGCLWSF